ncbi:hypothetical protein [Streptomyces sp. NRRL WC-3744]|uniref:hypothetical protein n=1 Tax=Streptomyces sp. NRRL WC-3744 TaxID=1463935 RepID=UPI00131B14B2|nr:hypothetical protein [Streptomyces sp. NRRL WC-3744]
MSPRRSDFGVSCSGYSGHQSTTPARAGRQAAEDRAAAETRAIRAEHHGACGAPRA